MLIKAENHNQSNKFKIYDFRTLIEEKDRLVENHAGEYQPSDTNGVSSSRLFEQKLQETYDSAFNDGLQQGEKTGFEKGLRSVEGEIKSLTDLVGSIARQQQEILSKSEQFVVDFALKVVEKILGVEEISNLRIDENKLRRIIGEALNQFAESTKYNIRVHRDSAETIEKYKSQIFDTLPRHVELSVTADPSLKPSEYLIESEHGVIDARIATQLNEIKNVVTKSKANGSTIQ
ncbi:MAG: FliH/SctL family protein [bacterium]